MLSIFQPFVPSCISIVASPTIVLAVHTILCCHIDSIISIPHTRMTSKATQERKKQPISVWWILLYPSGHYRSTCHSFWLCNKTFQSCCHLIKTMICSPSLSSSPFLYSKYPHLVVVWFCVPLHTTNYKSLFCNKDNQNPRFIRCLLPFPCCFSCWNSLSAVCTFKVFPLFNAAVVVLTFSFPDPCKPCVCPCCFHSRCCFVVVK